MDTSKNIDSIDTYIATFPKEMQDILKLVRAVIKEEVPEATEAMSYGMPTFKLHGKNIVHFAGWKSHIGFYPTPSGTEAFQKEIAGYKAAKGSIQFPLSEPMPVELIRKIVAFRVKQVNEK